MYSAVRSLINLHQLSEVIKNMDALGVGSGKRKYLTNYHKLDVDAKKLLSR